VNKKFFLNKTILITGGTGSFGTAIIKFLINNNFPLKKIIIFSRDELKQLQMQDELDEKIRSKFRFFIGDVRDRDRLNRALVGVDYLIHAAALKQVPTAEYNPFEFIKTNIVGSQNVIEACLNSNVSRVILLSTDKASSPINLYGATKLCADKLFISANNIKGLKDIRFSVVRYGNVMGSRGSVLNKFYEQSKNGIINLTHKDMTRFNISLNEAVKLVIWSLQKCVGGEIVVPKLSSFYLRDLAEVICPKGKIKIVGIRPGEKLHEEMISIFDAANTIEFKEHYEILPTELSKKYKNKKINFVHEGFSYRSDKNKFFLNKSDLKKIILKFNFK
jgi:UDP-N-acetylglucosamine 4,6-dehydratase (inverting)